MTIKLTKVHLISKSTKFYYTAQIAYDGFLYHGWQRQISLPTVQATILKALSQIVPEGASVNVIGASRTDAKVHAIEQVAQIIIEFKIEPQDLLLQLNYLLPTDIEITNIKQSHSKFMVIYQATKKDYYYLFSNDKITQVQDNHIVNFVEPLNLEQMKIGCKVFIGEHSFHNFQYKMNPNNTTTRTIFTCRIVKNPSYAPESISDIYSLEISGSGFLKQMVRIIMGTLINIGQGFSLPDEIYSSLHVDSPIKLGFISPAYGLHLQKIHY